MAEATESIAAEIDEVGPHIDLRDGKTFTLIAPAGLQCTPRRIGGKLLLTYLPSPGASMVPGAMKSLANSAVVSRD